MQQWWCRPCLGSFWSLSGGCETCILEDQRSVQWYSGWFMSSIELLLWSFAGLGIGGHQEWSASIATVTQENSILKTTLPFQQSTYCWYPEYVAIMGTTRPPCNHICEWSCKEIEPLIIIACILTNYTNLVIKKTFVNNLCLLYTSPRPRDA